MTKKNWIRQLSESYIRLNEANYGLGGRGARLVSTHKSDGSHSAKIYKLSDTGEFAVHFFKDGVHMGEDPVHYTDNLDDAKGTVALVFKSLKEAVAAGYPDDESANERLKDNYYKIHPLGKIINPKEFAKLNPRQRMEAGTFAREQGHTITHPHLLDDEHFRRGYGDGPSDDEEYFAPGLGPG